MEQNKVGHYNFVAEPFHAEWELSYVITGSGTRIVGDLMETFSNGEVVLIPPNIPHCWSFDKNIHDDKGKIENITIIFPDSLFDKCAYVFPETKRYISWQYVLYNFYRYSYFLH